jgi:hypothetical protein
MERAVYCGEAPWSVTVSVRECATVRHAIRNQASRDPEKNQSVSPIMLNLKGVVEKVPIFGQFAFLHAL